MKDMSTMNKLTPVLPELPAIPEDLARFILVGREKLISVRAEIRAIDKLHLAREVRDQKRDEARMLSEAVLDAEVRLGELFMQMPKASGGDRRSADFKNRGGADFVPSLQETKALAVERLGFSQDQAERFETLASHPDLVEQVKAEARENDDLPTRTAVLNLAKYREEKSKAEYRQIDEDCRLAQLLTKALTPIKILPTDKDSTAAMRRGDGPTVDGTRDSLRMAIKNLLTIQREYER